MKNTIEEGTDFYMNGKLLGKIDSVKDVTEPDGFPTFNVSIAVTPKLTRDECESVAMLLLLRCREVLAYGLTEDRANLLKDIRTFFRSTYVPPITADEGKG